MRGSVLDAIGGTPLLELDHLGPDDGAPLLAKWEGANPTGSMKDRMARAMILGAREAGELEPGHPVVEFTGGSTGTSLGLVCAALGHPLRIVTADCFSEEKIRSMRALGAHVEVLETPEGRTYPGLVDEMRARVTEVVNREGAYWIRQVMNPRNAHGYEGLGEEVLEDAPDVTDLVMSVGTGGCVTGTARVLKRERPDVRVTLVEPAETPYLSGGAVGSHSVEGIAVLPDPPLLEPELYDDVLAVPEAEGREMARRCAATEGLLVGASTGLNLAAAHRVAEERGPDATVVTVAVDTGLKYLRGELFQRG